MGGRRLKDRIRLAKAETIKRIERHDENNYIVVCLTERSSFKFKEFLTDYLEDEQNCQMAFLSLKKGTAIQMPDSRGVNLVSTDQDFLSFLHKKYEKVCVRE